MKEVKSLSSFDSMISSSVTPLIWVSFLIEGRITESIIITTTLTDPMIQTYWFTNVTTSNWGIITRSTGLEPIYVALKATGFH